MSSTPEYNIRQCIDLLLIYGSELKQAGMKEVDKSIVALSTYVNAIRPAASLDTVKTSSYDDTLDFMAVENQHGLLLIDFFNCSVDGFGVVLEQTTWANETVTSFGKDIVGGIFIARIETDSRAYYDGRLMDGDRVFEINGHTTEKMTLHRARWKLDSALRSRKLCLAVLRKNPESVDGVSVPSSSTDGSRESNDQSWSTEPLSVCGGATRESTPIRPQRSGRSSRSSSRRGTRHIVQKMHLLKEADKGLGIQTAGGKHFGHSDGDSGIFVTHVIRGSAAERDGRLNIGDEILWVNGSSLIGMTHLEAAQRLNSSDKLVQLVVSRKSNQQERTSSMLSSRSLRRRQRKRHDTESGDLLNGLGSIRKAMNRMSYPGLAKLANNNSMVGFLHGLKKVDLFKNASDHGLGISVIARSRAGRLADMKIFVDKVEPLGCAARSNGLHTGDQLLEVNGVTVTGKTSSEVDEILLGLKEGHVTVLIKEAGSESRFGDESHVFLVKLWKESGQGIGIGVGRADDKKRKGIFIQQIAAGSLAAKDGNLRSGDQVLEVNNKCLRNATLTDAFTVLANLAAGEVLMLIRRTAHPPTDISAGRSPTDTPPSVRNEAMASSPPEILVDLMSPAIAVGKYSSLARQDSIVSYCDSNDSYSTLQDDISIGSFRSHRSSGLHRSVNGIGAHLHINDCYSQPSKVSSSPHQTDAWVTAVINKDINDDSDAVSLANVDMVHSFRDTSHGTSQMTHGVNGVGAVLYSVRIDKTQPGSLGLGVHVEKTSSYDVHCGVFVKSVLDNSASSDAQGIPGGLVVGDEILEINGQILASLPPDAVKEMFNSLPQSNTLTVRRRPSENDGVSERKASLVQPHDSFSSNVIPNSIKITEQANKLPYIRRQSVIPDSFSIAKKSSPLIRQPLKIRESSVESTDSSTRGSCETDLDSRKGNGFRGDGGDSRPRSLLASVLMQSGTVSRSSSSVIQSAAVIGQPEIDRARGAMPLPGYIPEGLEAVLVTIANPQKRAIGLSLMSSSDSRTEGFFQVRRVLPGSLCGQSELSISAGDCLYSVNGVVMKDMTHPAAIQQLKTAAGEKSVTFVVFRPLATKGIGLSLLAPASRSSSSVSRLRDETLPSAEENDVHFINSPPCDNHDAPGATSPLAHPSPTSPADRKISTATRVLQIPTNASKDPSVNHVARRSSVTEMSDSDTEDETCSQASMSADSLPDEDVAESSSLSGMRLVVGKRSTTQPFMIEYQRVIRNLGLKLLIDEDGDVLITDVASSGLVAREGSIRVGDILISVNGEKLSGKPISKVQDILKSVPRGTARLIAMAPASCREPCESIRSDEAMLCANEAAVGIGSGDVGSIYLSPPSHFRSMADDASDVESLPPAPPRIIPQPVDQMPAGTSHRGQMRSSSMMTVDDDTCSQWSDTDSVMTALPPPPPRPSAMALPPPLPSRGPPQTPPGTIRVQGSIKQSQVARMSSIDDKSSTLLRSEVDHASASQESTEEVPLHMDSFLFPTSPKIIQHGREAASATPNDTATKKRSLFDKLKKKLVPGIRTKYDASSKSEVCDDQNRVGRSRGNHVDDMMLSGFDRSVARLKRTHSLNEGSVRGDMVDGGLSGKRAGSVSALDNNLSSPPAPPSFFQDSDGSDPPPSMSGDSGSVTTWSAERSSGSRSSAQLTDSNNSGHQATDHRHSTVSLLHFQFPPPPGDDEATESPYATIDDVVPKETDSGSSHKMSSSAPNDSDDWGSEFSSRSSSTMSSNKMKTKTNSAQIGMNYSRDRVESKGHPSSTNTIAMLTSDGRPLRPVPPIPLHDIEPDMNTSMMAEDDVSALYAIVNKGRMLDEERPQETESAETGEQHDSETLGEDGRLLAVQLVREPGGHPLGISIVGGSDTPLGHLYVKRILPGTVAEKTNQIASGDRLISINGVKLNDGTQVLAVDLLKNSPPLIELVLWRSSFDITATLPDIAPTLAATSGHDNLLEVATIASKVSKESDAVAVSHNASGQRSPRRELSSFSPPSPRSIDAIDRSPADDYEQWETFDIELKRQGKNGLGIAFSGKITSTLHEGLSVNRLLPGGLAERDGRLRRGDRVTRVNSHDLKGMSQGEALKILKEAPKRVAMTISRKITKNNEDRPVDDEKHGLSRGLSKRRSGSLRKIMRSLSSAEKYKVKDQSSDVVKTRPVSIHKDTSYDFGLDLQGGDCSMYGSTPLTVRAVKPGCVAAGQVRIGDHVTTVNQQDVEGMTQDEVMTYLRAQPAGVINIGVLDRAR